MGQVAEIESGGKGTAKCRRAERRQSIHQQRWTRGVIVAGNLDTLENLQRYDRVQNTHRQDDGEILPALALTQESENIYGVRQMNAQRSERRRWGQVVEMKR